MGPLARLPSAFRIPRLPTVRSGWEVWVFAGLALVALGLRLWELDGRTMHYDESLHVHYAWRLAVGEGYSHSPWMHGPFQVHMVAFIFKIFSDSDFTARLAYVFFGSALVAMPFFLRTYLGRTGAIVTAVLLVLSPSLLYFSRFGRNEIIMAFLAVALLALMWRYLNEGKNRYLYLSAAVLALIFATKETSYIITGIFGAALLLMSLPEIIALLFRKKKFSDLTGAPAFLLLLVTLTLPQWSALTSVFQGAMGLNLVNEDPGLGEVGMAVWGSPFVSFPVIDIPAALSYFIVAALVAVPVGTVLIWSRGRKAAKLVLPIAGVAALVFALVALPSGFVARDFLVSISILFGALFVSVMVGIMWRWRVWLTCAGIFYFIWIALQTSIFGAFVQNHGYCPGTLGGAFDVVCSKLGGIYTGSWQGLGYWLAQQDVQRGEQPMYYHFTIGSAYEFLPLLFGGIATVYYLRKLDLFGIMLGFWAVLTVVAYTIAGEKMPWLLVNVALPFILLSGKFFGDLIDRVRWRRLMNSAPSVLLVLAPVTLAAGVFLLHKYLKEGSLDSSGAWGLLAYVVVAAVALGYFIYMARPRMGFTLAGLGIGILLLGFSTFVAFRASYTYDDSTVEMLVFSQGSADVVKMTEILDEDVIGDSNGARPIHVDYDMWYPMNWYVRQEQKDGVLAFQRYKIDNACGSANCVPQHTCRPLQEEPSNSAFFIEGFCANQFNEELTDYKKSGPFRNLIWFPEHYKRPGANRTKESLGEELVEDFHYVKDIVTERRTWKAALDYFLFRDLSGDWWGEPSFFVYTAKDTSS